MFFFQFKSIWITVKFVYIFYTWFSRHLFHSFNLWKKEAYSVNNYWVVFQHLSNTKWAKIIPRTLVQTIQMQMPDHNKNQEILKINNQDQVHKTSNQDQTLDHSSKQDLTHKLVPTWPIWTIKVLEQVVILLISKEAQFSNYLIELWRR